VTNYSTKGSKTLINFWYPFLFGRVRRIGFIWIKIL